MDASIIFLVSLLGIILLSIAFLVIPDWRGDKFFVIKRFWKELQKVAEKENIPVTIHKNMKALNDYIYGDGYTDDLVKQNKGGLLACGVYRHSPGPELKTREIHLYTGGSVWTFAHELGHHFSIKLFGDQSEKSADKFVRTLVRSHMPWWHRIFIPIDISVYAPKK